MQQDYPTGLVWLRRDLRLQDHAALAEALQRCAQVHLAFVFDTDLLDPLPRTDRRVQFIRESLAQLDAQLRALSGSAPGAGLIVLHGRAVPCIVALAQQVGAQAVFAARDYEPQARARDEAVQRALQSQGAQLVLCKDQVVFEEREVLTRTASPYTVYTPYWRAWLARLHEAGEVPPTLAAKVAEEGRAANAAPAALRFGALLAERDSLRPLASRLAPRPTDLWAAGTALHAAQQLEHHPGQWRHAVPTMDEIGFESIDLAALNLHPGERGAQQWLADFAPRMDAYDRARDFPAIKGPSYLSVHLRFGTVSLRALVRAALQAWAQGSEGAQTWLKELVWREFYFQILANFPQVAHSAFRPEYDAIVWEQGAQAQVHYAAWCEGRTGYPLVDAAMAQLNHSGYMHNRLRMVAGSFLVKHLGLDWRWGERYFALQLNDFDLAANNGGWQWVASSGCDAQPYFRIFNPISQSEKFDADGRFIRRYLPQLAGLGAKAIHAPWMASPLELQAAGVVLGRDYPHPIVDHASARERTLQRYAVVKRSG